ncbi:phage tail sheath family protein [Paenibacillus flagellatus]|uniref:phage tail sheath family protein n=1 Tax=Paenibacillus flagellatus TaxID=2211139 RepID=UPI001B868437|nr:phage tail sheath family protein [Paenibacillus flagellatus]
MAGGTWVTQNKVRPGIYINFVNRAQLGTVGERGVMTMALSLSWGAPKTVITLNAGDDLKDVLGYDITAPQMLLIREAFKRAQTVRLFRLNTGTKATATHGSLTATAKYGGLRGNDIKIVVQTNIDDSAKFDVKTLVSDVEVDLQTVANIAGLTSNAWVDFSGTGTLTTTAGVPLTNGADGSVANQDHSDYLAAIELHEFQTMALPATDSTLKSVYISFVKRLREDEGRKIQLVVENYPAADYEGVISVKNGVKLADGTTIPAAQATVWVAAATAGAEMNESLTYAAYNDAVDVDTRYSNSQIEAALKAGEFVFIPNNGRAVVEQDINTLTGFTPEKGKAFSKNRVIRVLDGIANDFKRIFESFYIGKVNNNADGRNLFKKECTGYLATLQGVNAIQNFDVQTDVTVLPGNDTDAIVVNAAVQPVDSIEKVYMTVINAIQNFDVQTDVTVLPGNDTDAIVVNAAVQPVDSIEKVYMTVEVN